MKDSKDAVISPPSPSPPQGGCMRNNSRKSTPGVFFSCVDKESMMGFGLL